MEEKEKEKNTIKQYAVRLEIDGEVGSGFIYAPQESDYVYIFTVYHVINKMQTKEFKIQYNEIEVPCENQDIEYCIMDSTLELEKKGDFEESQFEGRREDVAVLRIPKPCFGENVIFPEEILCIDENLIEKEKEFEGFGYPNKKEIEIGLSGIIKKWNKENGIFFCQAKNVIHPNFAEAMAGFSGTGLTVRLEERLVLAGLVVSCTNDEMHSVFRAVGISEIREKMKEKGWEIPEQLMRKTSEDSFNRVPENFFVPDIKDLEMEYIKDAESGIKNEIYQKFYLINQKVKLEELAKYETFFEIPICEKQERKICNYYWAGRLLSLLLLEYVNGDVSKNKCILADGKEVNIEFICSEGDGKADLGAVVASAINRNVLGAQIKGDSILVWQSNKNPARQSFKRKKFRNIVKDIASSNLEKAGEENGYHLLNGEMKQKDYGILHINKFLECLTNCMTAEEIEETVREVLNDVWK